MSFLHPLALLGLAAAAIPALLHLLQRRTPPELEFPPLRYLSEAERQSARRLKLRHLLLLVLRTALVIVVVLAAARPLVPVTVGGGGGAHEPTALVVILDNSPSSGAVVDGRPVLDRLKRAARGSIAGAAPGDRLWLVLADGIARAGSRNALLAAVDSAAPDARRLDLVRAVARAARVVDGEPLPAREVHVLSDLQRTALDSGEARIPKGVAVLALGRGGAAPANRGIASASVMEGTVAVAVVGTAGAGTAPVAIRVQRRGGGGGGPVARALAEVGTTVTLPLAPPLLPAGWWTGEAELEPDELRADDRRLFAWHVAPPARVTVTPGGGSFVAAALAVLRDGRRVAEGSDVVIGDGPGGERSVVLPPADPALVGQVNRALAARGVGWRFAGEGTPGPVVSDVVGLGGGVVVTRRYRLEGGLGAGGSGLGKDSSILATVNGEPWLVRDADVVLVGSRLDTTWTALPASPGFVPFLDALVNRVVRGEAELRDAEGAPRVAFALRGADTVGATVYGIDRRESDLTPADNALVARALDARVLDERAFASQRFAGTRGADVSAVLLVCALLLAAVELAAATLTR